MLKKNKTVVEVISVATQYKGHVDVLTLSQELFIEHNTKIYEMQCGAKKVFRKFMILFNVTDEQSFKRA